MMCWLEEALYCCAVSSQKATGELWLENIDVRILFIQFQCVLGIHIYILCIYVYGVCLVYGDE